MLMLCDGVGEQMKAESECTSDVQNNDVQNSDVQNNDVQNQHVRNLHCAYRINQSSQKQCDNADDNKDRLLRNKILFACTKTFL